MCATLVRHATARSRSRAVPHGSRIRAGERETGRHVPIIAVTAHTRSASRDRCLAAGMDGYIEKPIKAGELYQTIDALCAAGEKLLTGGEAWPAHDAGDEHN
jgi:CheY-like chemotaxis protein